MNNTVIEEAVGYLEVLREDEDVSKRFKEKAEAIIVLLKSDVQLCVEKALFELEELSSGDLSAYHKTQVWDVISLLESSKK